jgi:hypothetical protein
MAHARKATSLEEAQHDFGAAGDESYDFQTESVLSPTNLLPSPSSNPARSPACRNERAVGWRAWRRDACVPGLPELDWTVRQASNLGSRFSAFSVDVGMARRSAGVLDEHS